MKKKLIVGIVIIILATLIILYFSLNKKNVNLPEGICDNSYQRITDVDTETIRFGCDKSFSYFYAVGDPVEDSDLCETYSYDGETIKLNCDGSRYDNKIKIVSYDEHKLTLKINDEERTFEKKLKEE